MSTATHYHVFLSAVSKELGSYRAKVAAVLRRKGLTVCEQQDFRQGGGTLIQSLADYIAQCDAVILLVGERCGGQPTDAHAASLGEVAEAPYADYRAHSSETALSYTQWEYLLARHHNRRTLVYETTDDFTPDEPNPEGPADRRRQQAYRAWLRHLGKHTEPLTTQAKLVEDVLVQDFPDVPFTRPTNLPLSLDDFFQGREEVLEALRGQLRAAPTAGTGGVQSSVIVGKALHGLGGVGKTRLAVEYGWRYRTSYAALLLVAADSPADLDRNLAALCGAPVLNLPEQDVPEEARQRAAVLHWLRTTPGWLLVLDNLDTPEARQAAEALLRTQLPGAQGHVLMTSRLSNWRPALRPLELDVLTEAAAAHLLLTFTEGRRRPTPDEQTVAIEIARVLGQLPLALEVAAAYIATRRKSLRYYLERWQANRAALLAWFDEAVIDYPRSMAVTWQTSFDQLRQESPDAQLLLNRLAWLAPDPIPETLLAVPVPNAPPYAEDPVELLAHLTRYSLARQDLHSDTFTVHRLVQAVTRQRLGKAEADARLVEALGWVNDAFEGNAQDVRSWPTLEPLLPHALAVTATEYTEPLGNPEPTSRLLNQVGQLLDTKAQLREAEPLVRRVLAITEAHFSSNHPKVATSLNNLAALLINTNRLSEAEPFMRRAVAIGEENSGLYDPNTAIYLGNLAQLLEATDHLKEAEEMMRRALALDETHLGPNHPNVAIRLNNLATFLRVANCMAEAESLMQRALTINEASFGPVHPKVATSLSNLAALYQVTNRLPEAETFMRRALSIDESCFGPGHPNVAIRLNNLAIFLRFADCMAEAEPLMQRAFLIFHNLGWEHPYIHEATSNYTRLLMAKGHTQEQALASIQALLREAADQQPPQ
ncbi:tetratricopeptide repeat protein [Hymenobacter ruricola]|uniref:Tetratricopeptide repeat protein n=1 Tax=Hymenobacter ruricola TaxID=2791023 RepID=A0ABS0I813_9BACT|nr:tetratricopeptide repeat protein [Hymenobacter ruricola]MBF9223096.1 tetratricopeptide repeat protein [Hymenobacter ruricola]